MNGCASVCFSGCACMCVRNGSGVAVACKLIIVDTHILLT